jgi:hypothetical protein
MSRRERGTNGACCWASLKLANTDAAPGLRSCIVSKFGVWADLLFQRRCFLMAIGHERIDLRRESLSGPNTGGLRSRCFVQSLSSAESMGRQNCLGNRPLSLVPSKPNAV